MRHAKTEGFREGSRHQVVPVGHNIVLVADEAVVPIWFERGPPGACAELLSRLVGDGGDREAAAELHCSPEVPGGLVLVDDGLLGEGVEEGASEGAAGGHDAVYAAN